VKAAYLVTIDGLHPNADTWALGKRMAELLNVAASSTTVIVTQQWVMPSEADMAGYRCWRTDDGQGVSAIHHVHGPDEPCPLTGGQA
jgi:hypothetical protein